MMALGIVRRWSWVPAVVGIGLVQGCSSSGGDDDSGSSSGCSKDSDCKNGRICENKVCVNDNGGSVLGGSSGTGNGQGGSSMPASGGTGNKGGSSGTQGGSGGTNGGSSGNGGSASGSGGTGGSASGTGGSGNAPTSGPCASADDPATCPTTDSMTYCDGSMLVTVTCSDFCTMYGFPPLACTAGAGCDCDVNNPTDAVCDAATGAYCSCLADGCVTMPDPNDPDSIYLYPPVIYAACHAGQQADKDFFHCIYDQAMLDPLPLCSDAFAACGAGTGGSAGAPAQ